MSVRVREESSDGRLLKVMDSNKVVCKDGLCEYETRGIEFVSCRFQVINKHIISNHVTNLFMELLQC